MSKKRQSVIVVQGGQFGSEGKGAVAAHLSLTRMVDYAVRTGSINAGHTVYYKHMPYKMQQLPTAWVNPATTLVIGPGAYIHPPTLEREVKMISAVLGEDLKRRLYIDYRCSIHCEEHETVAKYVNRHQSIGATGKGCSEAIIEKIGGRGSQPPEQALFRHSRLSDDYRLEDVSKMLNRGYDDDAQILIEGTQGTGLDLHQGPWPYTTGRMTTAANWVAEAGLSPNLDYEVVLVLRTHPIRVAGNSGPMRDEISWPILMRRMNQKLAARGLPPRVLETSIIAFEQALALQDVYELPYSGAAREQYAWDEQTRAQYAHSVSNLNSYAMKYLMEQNGPAYSDLAQTMEMTTVTGKPRRIAEFDEGQARDSVQIERPDHVVLTFLNYDLPWLWDQPVIDDEARKLVYSYEQRIGAPISMVSTGPDSLVVV